MRLSIRDIGHKTAGEKEKKRADGVNFEFASKKLEEGGVKATKDDIINFIQQNPTEIPFSRELLDKIFSLEINENRNKYSKEEAYFIIVGSILTSESLESAKEKISDIGWYVVFLELNAGSLSKEYLSAINLNDPNDIQKLTNSFNSLYSKVQEKKIEVKKSEEKSKSGGYISNVVEHDFGDGWKVIYVPAVGEIEPFPGIINSSYDRILEGNKNGLCLGSSTNFYQNNLEGKIYSVRDPSNNPKVTIRIKNNRLEEAKGKNNNPPEPEGARRAEEWFKTIAGLDYKNNYDFSNFPPFDLEAASIKFREDRNKPYHLKWVSLWYKNGIPELDEDVIRRVSEKDPMIISSGLGKIHKELVEPVVKHFCENFIEGSYTGTTRRDRTNAFFVLFGGLNPLPSDVDHEVFKTYRKLPEMVSAVEKLAEIHPRSFYKLGLQEYPEYRQFSDKPVEIFASDDPKVFLSEFSEKEWARPHLDSAIKSAFEKKPEILLDEKIINKDFVRPYIEKAAEVFAEKNKGKLAINFVNFYKSNEKFRNLPNIKKCINICFQDSLKYPEDIHLAREIFTNLKNDDNFTSFKKNAMIIVLSFPGSIDYHDYDKDTDEIDVSIINENSNLVLEIFSEKSEDSQFISSLPHNFYFENLNELESIKSCIILIGKNLADNSSLEILKKFNNIKGYEELLRFAAKKLIEYNPCRFLDLQGEIEEDIYAEFYDEVAKKCLLRNPVSFIGSRHFYLDNNAEYDYLTLNTKFDYQASEDLLVAIINRSNELKKYEDHFLNFISNNHPRLIALYYDELSEINKFKNYINSGIKNFINSDPDSFIDNYVLHDRVWSYNYLDYAVMRSIEQNPYEFLSNYYDYDWAQEYLEMANEKAMNEPRSIKQSSLFSRNKIISLGKIMLSLGFKREHDMAIDLIKD